MDLRELQRRVDEDFGEADRRSGLLFLLSVLVEEVGELARALRKSGDEPDNNVEDEIADIFFVLLGLANVLGVDLEEAFSRKILSVDREKMLERWTDLPWKKQGDD